MEKENEKINTEQCEENLEEQCDELCEEEGCECTEETPCETSNEEKCEVNSGEMEKLKKEYEELNEKYLRLYADFDNYKKRAVKDKADALTYAVSPLVEKLLSVLDNFDRALASGESDSPFYEGVKMVSKQLNDILHNEGLCEIECEGKPFDPNYHNAVMVDNLEDVEDNIITQQLQKGYTFKERVIRSSMVKVNKHN